MLEALGLMWAGGLFDDDDGYCPPVSRGASITPPVDPTQYNYHTLEFSYQNPTVKLEPHNGMLDLDRVLFIHGGLPKSFDDLSWLQFSWAVAEDYQRRDCLGNSIAREERGYEIVRASTRLDGWLPLGEATELTMENIKPEMGTITIKYKVKVETLNPPYTT